MDTLKNFNDAIDYIEAHLTDEISMERASRLAGCSEHHFKRMFSFLAGIGVAEYVRKRRLSLAANDLFEQESKVIDVAVKYGYESADAFTRAFHAMHGVLPSEVKQHGRTVIAYPKLSFYLSIRGGTEMKVRLIEKEAFKVVGYMRRIPIQFEGVNPEIAKIYARLNEKNIALLKAMSNVEPNGIISASTNFSEGRMSESGELDHFIGVLTTEAPVEDFDALEVAAGMWAVFEVVGPFPETLQATWGRIYAEWFPSSDYESIAGPEIVWHESKDTSNPNYRSEIWIPVKKTTTI